jgi:hypothetical protein
MLISTAATSFASSVHTARLRLFDHLRRKRHRRAAGLCPGPLLIVSDIRAARAELLGKGVAISEVFHDSAGEYAGPDEPYLFGRLRVTGPAAEPASYHSFASFHDPDGNGLAAAGGDDACARAH